MFENDNSGNSTGICCLDAAYLAMCLSKPKFIEYPRASFDIVCSLLGVYEHVLFLYQSRVEKHLIHFYWNICYRCAGHMYRLLLFLLQLLCTNVHHSFVTTHSVIDTHTWRPNATLLTFQALSFTISFRRIWNLVTWYTPTNKWLQPTWMTMASCSALFCINAIFVRISGGTYICAGGCKSLATLEFLLSEIIFVQLHATATCIHINACIMYGDCDEMCFIVESNAQHPNKSKQ